MLRQSGMQEEDICVHKDENIREWSTLLASMVILTNEEINAKFAIERASE